jgi:hypothetical protein
VTLGHRSYICRKGTVAAIINVVINPVIAWLVNRRDFVPLLGANSIVVDVAVTSVALSLLVAFFVTRVVRHDLHAGHITFAKELAPAGFLISRLPDRAWSLGLSIGIAAALTLTPLIFNDVIGGRRAGRARGIVAVFPLLEAVGDRLQRGHRCLV